MGIRIFLGSFVPMRLGGSKLYRRPDYISLLTWCKLFLKGSYVCDVCKPYAVVRHGEVHEHPCSIEGDMCGSRLCNTSRCCVGV
jgi:hypothetical protein